MKTIFFFLIIFVFSAFVVKAQKPSKLATVNKEYFPLPDSLGGWRTLTNTDDIKRITSMDKTKLDDAFRFEKSTTQNGGLLVVRHGYLVYENYFGKGQREATPNLGSCGKSFTSIAVGILMSEYPDLFPDGLDQKFFTPVYLPSEAFPLPDPRMEDIKLGQLLAFTSGIRGWSPGFIYKEPLEISPEGLDGWCAMVDEYALGLEHRNTEEVCFSPKTLWCEPGRGFSYATASAHIASIMLRHITGIELEDYIEMHIANPLGWGQWGFGYKNHARIDHTPGGGGIALRSTDMLRFCYMLLRKGKWNGLQVVPKEYVHAASNASPYNPHFPYSFQFSVNSHGEINELPRDAYWKSGSGGHCLYIVPSLDLIVWKLGGRDDQYGMKNTGLPEPKPLPNAEQPITEGQNFQGDVYAKTLELVISSIVEENINSGALPGQIIPDPNYPNKVAYNKDDDHDGQFDPIFLCRPGDPERFLYSNGLELCCQEGRKPVCRVQIYPPNGP